MTENEAIKYIQRDIYFINKMIEHDKRFDPKADMNRYLKAKTAYETAISALEEIQQYREIGTVEECQEAVDKQKPKKPIKQKGNCFSKGKSGEEQHEIILICPLCGGKALKRGYPCKCGQAIQWDEDLEDIENGT